MAYVFVVTAMTLPVSLLLPMGVGLLRTGVRNLGDLVPALGRRFGRGGETEWLLGVNALFSILLISHPEVPHFGGVKHWLPRCRSSLCWPGGSSSARRSVCRRRWNSRRGAAGRRAVLLGAIVSPAFTLTVHVHPYSVRLRRAGRRHPGAASLGFQRQYWSNNVTGVLPWIDANSRAGARVAARSEWTFLPRVPAQ